MVLPDEEFDEYLISVLRKAQPEFAFVTNPGYDVDLPAELVWVLIAALIQDKGMTLNKAARVVQNFIERRSNCIESALRHDTQVSIFDKARIVENHSRELTH